MNEPQSRLFGYLTMGPDGRYGFRTVRPGAYRQPRNDVPRGEESWIPQRIRYEVTHGFQPRRFRMVFGDDPRMTSSWQRRAKTEVNPVVKVTISPDGAQACECDVDLKP